MCPNGQNPLHTNILQS